MIGREIIGIQKRMMQLGRVRLGEKGGKGEPKKLSTFRFTSASRELLKAVADLYGGKVREWEGAPDEGYFEVITDAKELRIVLPPVFSSTDGTPTTSYSQWYELWSGGGCQRRCDGRTEALSGNPCMCNPDDRACQITTRVSFMLPDVPGLGVWRLDSKGWNAAVELPGTLEVLMMAAAENSFVPARLRIEHRTRKEPGKGTRRFIVPVLDLPDIKIGELLAATQGQRQLSANAPVAAPARPALPAAPAPPEEPAFSEVNAEPPPLGEPPALPNLSASASAVTVSPVEERSDLPSRASEAEPVLDPEAEALISVALELAQRFGGAEAEERAASAILAQRKKHDGAVTKAWMDKLVKRLRDQLPGEPVEAEPAGSLFKPPESARR